MEQLGPSEDTMPHEPVFDHGQAETVSVRGMAAAAEQQRQLLPPVDKNQRRAWKLARKEATQNAEHKD